ncbi:TPA: hypothetical protein DEP34_00330 [Candidatus Uhrbacteria bacterium]|uniref:Uncharacterized protein n=1 Tax=Candidatus Uhrbacteria bacterium GW2011_GWF2_46_218 TaxID=1619001 RepID=A0A0G1PID6_9BACT|nr:MAG: hypothetical protein UX45_C0016G0008 [Candidatus Uhrbacteria bacterium GW2011_GWF2_46_218]HBK33407.1 hypothetical protein [Candidatus Uhrbacteria bacterium]HCB18819.1 hypothetical protein [Candidatus Uhrbacteria bacterium]
MQDFSITITSSFYSQPTWLDLFLKNFDPSLFQNITLGVLAIFIPFAIVFLTDILNSKKEKKSEFEKMVLSDEVLGTKKVFWLSIIGIIFFAFFTGKDISNFAKLIAILASLILVSLYWSPFKKILRFSEGYKPEFEIPFLRKLSFSKIFKYRNKVKAEKMVRAWNSFWSEKSESNERDFTNVFISHIDDSIKLGKFDLAVQLAQIYTCNIEKRDRFSIGYEILPKVFEWNEILWKEQHLWLKGYDTENRIQSFISQKYFPTFKHWTLKLYKKTNSEKENFWNWHYFGGEFFQAIVKTLLKDGHGPYQLFTSFKKHIEESKQKLDKIEDAKKKEKYWHYVTELFASFCPTFFNEIDSAPSNYGIWEHDFPSEWKITIANKDNRISRVILHEFLQWSRDRIFKKENEENFDKDLTEVINGIFPNVHSSLFTAFLMLFVSSEVKYALEKEPNFYILGVSVSRSGSIEESEEDRDKRLAEMMKAKDSSQKEETVQVILKFFHFWQTLTIYKDNLSEDESKNWESYTEEQRKSIVKKVRKEKLEKIKAEIESEEIKKICGDSERKELYRKDFLELIELLILEIEK